MTFWHLFGSRLGRRSVAAVEFALIAPVLLILFIGTIEMLTLYRTEAKLNALVIDVGEMVSVVQEASPSTNSSASGTSTITSLNDICNLAIAGLAPYPSAGLKIEIASVTMEPSALNSNSPANTPVFDEWEQDYQLAAPTSCTTAAGTAILSGTGSSAPITIATANSATSTGSGAKITTVPGTGMFEEPCDNVIIVQASINYSGLTGLILKNHPTLTQTAYTRWTNSSTLEQLLCPGCNVPTTPLDYCNTNNSSAVN